MRGITDRNSDAFYWCYSYDMSASAFASAVPSRIGKHISATNTSYASDNNDLERHKNILVTVSVCKTGNPLAGPGDFLFCNTYTFLTIFGLNPEEFLQLFAHETNLFLVTGTLAMWICWRRMNKFIAEIRLFLQLVEKGFTAPLNLGHF